MRILSSLAFAAICCAAPLTAEAAPAKPVVIFFAGYSSTAVDVADWLRAARAAPVYGSDFTFEAVPYPAGTSPDEHDANNAGKAVIASTAKRIVATPTQSFVVVGHSSGAALAASVVERVPDRTNVKLVILDDGVDEGFTPPHGFNLTRQVECWSVANRQLVSFNLASTMAFCANYHELQAATCKTDVCLHFAIVNLNAAPDLTYDTAFAISANGGTGGYRNLRVNLSWLTSSIGF